MDKEGRIVEELILTSIDIFDQVDRMSSLHRLMEERKYYSQEDILKAVQTERMFAVMHYERTGQISSAERVACMMRRLAAQLNYEADMLEVTPTFPEPPQRDNSLH